MWRSREFIEQCGLPFHYLLGYYILPACTHVLFTLMTSSQVCNAAQVRARVTCEAAGPWGMAGTIEGIMVQQSATSVQGYLDFCNKYCRLALADKVQMPCHNLQYISAM